MSQSQLTFRLQAPPSELWRQMQELAQKHGGEVQGDEKCGRVALRSSLRTIEGNYAIEGDQLHLTITKKPFWLGYETIGAAIRGYLAGIS